MRVSGVALVGIIFFFVLIVFVVGGLLANNNRADAAQFSGPLWIEIIDSNDRTDARDAVNDYLAGVEPNCVNDIEYGIGNKHVDNFVIFIERKC